VWCRTAQASTAAGALPCTARRCPPPRLPKRARCGVALVGNPEEVDEVASPNPNDGPGRKPGRIKGGLVKSELAVRASEPTGEQLRQV
jgi:hypothetical protein